MQRFLAAALTALLLLTGRASLPEAPGGEEHLLITTIVCAEDGGRRVVFYDYHVDTGALECLHDTPDCGLFPASAVDYDEGVLYYAAGVEGDGYDNLYRHDLETGETARLTDGKFHFDKLMFLDGKLYASAAREGATVCQPAVFDPAAGDFTCRNVADDDTWHHSFSYDPVSGQFLILTCSDAEMRTYHVAAETHIRPKTVSLLDRELQSAQPLYFTDRFEIRLTRRWDENHILMTTDPYMGSGPRTLRLLTIDTQEVRPFEIPGVWTVYLFEPSADASRLFFVGRRGGDSDWTLYQYTPATGAVQPLPLPDTVSAIPDIQYVCR